MRIEYQEEYSIFTFSPYSHKEENLTRRLNESVKNNYFLAQYTKP